MFSVGTKKCSIIHFSGFICFNNINSCKKVIILANKRRKESKWHFECTFSGQKKSLWKRR